MENNIFFKNKNDKYNPDINNKFSQKETERINNNYNLSNVIYNPITGIIPNIIKTPDDLKINNEINIYDINKLISDKELERKQQEQLFKNNEKSILNNQQTKVINNYNQNNYNDNFNELKEKSLINNNNNNENKKFNNILIELKDLGILN
jgi:hypothetical protein